MQSPETTSTPETMSEPMDTTNSELDDSNGEWIESPIDDATYDILMALTSKLEAIDTYQVYADDGNAEIEKHGWAGYAAWHLAVDPDATEETKKRFAFPYGDFSKVNRAALIHGKQRAVQNGHDEIAEAADRLLQRLDRLRSR